MKEMVLDNITDVIMENEKQDRLEQVLNDINLNGVIIRQMVQCSISKFNSRGFILRSK